MLPDHENRCPDLVSVVPRSEKWCGKRVTGCATAPALRLPVPRTVPRKFHEKTSKPLVLLGSSTVPRFLEMVYNEFLLDFQCGLSREIITKIDYFIFYHILDPLSREI